MHPDGNDPPRRSGGWVPDQPGDAGRALLVIVQEQQREEDDSAKAWTPTSCKWSVDG